MKAPAKSISGLKTNYWSSLPVQVCLFTLTEKVCTLIIESYLVRSVLGSRPPLLPISYKSAQTQQQLVHSRSGVGRIECLFSQPFISGSLESPMAASPAQSYHPSSTYFHQECQWFFDPPPSRQLILKISTAHKMSKYCTYRVSQKSGFFGW